MSCHFRYIVRLAAFFPSSRTHASQSGLMAVICCREKRLVLGVLSGIPLPVLHASRPAVVVPAVLVRLTFPFGCATAPALSCLALLSVGAVAVVQALDALARVRATTADRSCGGQESGVLFIYLFSTMSLIFFFFFSPALPVLGAGDADPGLQVTVRPVDELGRAVFVSGALALRVLLPAARRLLAGPAVLVALFSLATVRVGDAGDAPPKGREAAWEGRRAVRRGAAAC